MKNTWRTPTLVTIVPMSAGDDTVIGGGTGQGNTGEIIMVDFDEWVEMYGNPDSTITDYYNWWIKNGFDDMDWEDMNPGIPWPGENP